MKQKIIFIKGDYLASSATLLIPEFLLERFNKKRNEFGSIKSLFQYVVNRKHRAYSYRPVTSSGRTTYQSEGSRLYRRDFFPNNEDWEKFRLYANARRVSMTLLFVIILLDWEGFEEEVPGVPSIPQQIQLSQSLTISEILIYLQIEHLIL